MSEYMRLFRSKLRKPKRITISLDVQIEDMLNQIQENLKSGNENWSLSKTTNVVLLTGMLSEDSLSSSDWSKIQSFMNGTRIEVENIPVKEYVLTLLEIKRISRKHTLTF